MNDLGKASDILQNVADLKAELQAAVERKKAAEADVVAVKAKIRAARKAFTDALRFTAPRKRTPKEKKPAA